MARLISLLVLLEVLVVPAQFAHPQPTDSAPEGDGTTTGDPQAADTEGVPNDDLDLGTDVITPTRSLTPLFETPYSSDVVGARLKEHQYRTLPEALRDVPGAMVQKTGHGQEKPGPSPK